MTTVERTFRLEGPSGLGGRPDPGLLGSLLVQLPETPRDSVGMGIEADALLPAPGQDEFFRDVPKALAMPDYESMVRLRPGEVSPYRRILGVIPAEGSDEEFARLVEEFS